MPADGISAAVTLPSALETATALSNLFDPVSLSDRLNRINGDLINYLVHSLIISCDLSLSTCAHTVDHSGNSLAVRVQAIDEDDVIRFDSLGAGAAFGTLLTSLGMDHVDISAANPSEACGDDSFTVIPSEDVVPFFAIAKRGGCTFVTKARSAQRAGAIGLLVIDHIDGDVTHDVVRLVENDKKWTLYPFSLSDDGTSFVSPPIVIPTVLINGRVAHDIWEWAQSNRESTTADTATSGKRRSLRIASESLQQQGGGGGGTRSNSETTTATTTQSVAYILMKTLEETIDAQAHIKSGTIVPLSKLESFSKSFI